MLDCEKVTIRISTNHKNTIDEVVELEVGNRSYNVRVVELENKIIYRQRSRCKGDWEKSLEFQSTVRNGHIQGEEIDAIKAIVLGKDYNESILNDTRFLKGHVGDFQFMSNGLKAVKKKVIEGKESSAEIGTSK
ncbi:hypothetical protein V6N13_124173 [Hibiscus sabdariffa]